MANGDNATTCSPVLTVHLPPIDATSDVVEHVSAIFLPKIHHKIETMLLKLKSSPSIPVHTLLGNDFDIDELLQVRNVIFECANERYSNENQPMTLRQRMKRETSRIHSRPVISN